MTAPHDKQAGFTTLISNAPLPLGTTPDSREPAPLAAAPPGLKENLVAAVWKVVDRYDWVLSATFTGSFLVGEDLQGISDIDLVVIAEHLNAERFETLNQACEAALRPVLAESGLGLRINPTLGPLKLNDQQTAVLHLMVYSRSAHIDHVIRSPFTCFDWQRSSLWRKLSMAAVYPVFALQPHHFVSARRSVSEYLGDYRTGVVSYRELHCDGSGCREQLRQQPMTARCRHEFAYHILRFLTQNLLKLVQHRNEAPDGEKLLSAFLSVFPLDGDDVRRLYGELAAKKRAADFSWPVPDLDRRLERFVNNYEAQFRRLFQTEATRHIMFRHAATALNAATGSDRRFVGRTNPEIVAIDDAALKPLLDAIASDEICTAFVSPLLRCQQTIDLLADRLSLPAPTIDNRLLEIDYGRCEGQTASVARRTFPELFSAWQRGDDPAFPGGESTADVSRRALGFVDDRWPAADGSTITCTHNVVLRTLLGHALQVPRQWWHRLQIPHLQPITFVQTRSYGWFADLDESVERQIFAEFAGNAKPQAI